MTGCKERVWDKGDTIDCGAVDVSAVVIGICHCCARHQLPSLLKERRRLEAELVTLNARIARALVATGSTETGL